MNNTNDKGHTPKWEITIETTVNYSRDFDSENPELKRHDFIIEAETEAEAIALCKKQWHEGNYANGKGIWDIYSNGHYEILQAATEGR